MKTRRVSHSEFKAYRRCRRSWWLGYLRGYTYPLRDVGALELGSITHTGMEFLYDGTDYLVDALESIRAEVERRIDLLDRPTEELVDSLKAAGQDAQNYCRGYVEWAEVTGADQRYVHVASEEELEMPLIVVTDDKGLHEPVQWNLIGKLDRRVEDRMTGLMRYMDFKTTANFAMIMENALRNEQFPTYDLLLKHNHDQALGGGIWRMIKKTKRARDGDGEFFKDHEFSFNDTFKQSVLWRWKALAMEMQHTAWDLENGIEHQLAVPPTPDFSCSWQCDFKHVCDMFDDGSRAEDALDGLYVHSDPYARYRILGRETE